MIEEKPKEILPAERVPEKDGTEMYRLALIKGDKIFSINGVHADPFPINDWVFSKTEIVDSQVDPSKSYFLGFHVIEDFESAQKYLKKINVLNLDNLRIIKVEVGEVRRKPLVNKDVYLVDKIKILEIL